LSDFYAFAAVETRNGDSLAESCRLSGLQQKMPDELENKVARRT